MGNLMGLLWKDGHAGFNYNLPPLFEGEGGLTFRCKGPWMLPTRKPKLAQIAPKLCCSTNAGSDKM